MKNFNELNEIETFLKTNEIDFSEFITSFNFYRETYILSITAPDTLIFINEDEDTTITLNTKLNTAKLTII